MIAQLDLFPPPAPPPPPVYVPRARIDVQTRAAQHGGIITITEGDPLPFDVEVRGVPCVFASGSTYAVNPVGSLFWSETGFRSFGYHTDDADAARAMIERFIDAPPVHGNGCGGKLVRWWPTYVHHWRQTLGFILGRDRATTWDQWGPEKHAETWANTDARLAEQVARMRAEGIDPNDVGPPPGFRGKWPKVTT